MPHTLRQDVLRVETRAHPAILVVGGIAAILIPLAVSLGDAVPPGLRLGVLCAASVTILTVLCVLACPRSLVAFDIGRRNLWIGHRRVPLSSLEAIRLSSKLDGTIALSIRVAGNWAPLLEGVLPRHHRTLEGIADALKDLRASESGYREPAQPPLEVIRDLVLPATPAQGRKTVPTEVVLERALLGCLAATMTAVALFTHFAEAGPRGAAAGCMMVATFGSALFSTFAFQRGRIEQR